MAEKLAHLFGRRRLLVALFAGTLWSALLSLPWQSSLPSLLTRTYTASLAALIVFGVFEEWPRRLPSWLARWVLQVLSVAAAIPGTMYLFWTLSTPTGEPPFWQVQDRLGGFLLLSVTGVLVAPWIAMSALLRGRDALVREQAHAFERERGELERVALEARHRLLHAQVQPHFLFNTLANVRELVESGSAQAPVVLGHLIAYLRAAVPRLDEPVTTLGRELELVRAYLELMRMRMPDRLSFALQIDDATRSLRCPPLTVLSLVENAVRHGIDPSEDGGRIDVRVVLRSGRCRIEVADTGVGIRPGSAGLGTGLSALRERLALTFAGDAQLRLSAQVPHGVVAEVDFPAETGVQ